MTPRLFKINHRHIAPRGSHESARFVIAMNEDVVFDRLSELNYGVWRDQCAVNEDRPLEEDEILSEDGTQALQPIYSDDYTTIAEHKLYEDIVRENRGDFEIETGVAEDWTNIGIGNNE